MSMKKGENRGEMEGLVFPAPRRSQPGTLHRAGAEWPVISSFQSVTSVTAVM